MENMTDGELAVKYAVESTLRKLLAISKEAKDKDEIVTRIKSMLGEDA